MADDFVLPSDATPSSAPPSFTLPSDADSTPPPSRLQELGSAVTDIPNQIYQAGKSAISTIAGQFNPYSEANTQKMERLKNESFTQGLGEQAQSIGDVGSAVAAVPALAAAPITGTARSLLGHTFNAANPLTPEDAAKAGVPYVSGQEAADTAMMGLAPSRGGLRAPVPLPQAPVPSGPLGVTLSAGQESGELPLIQKEQAAIRGGMGASAQERAQAFVDQQKAQTQAAREAVSRSLDPFGQQIATSPQEAGQAVSQSMQSAAQSAKTGVRQAYTTAQNLPGEIHAGAFEGIGQKIKGDLTLGDNPVIVDDTLTPHASKMIQYLDNNVANLNIPNRADPFGAPSPENITGVSLKGIEQWRKNLSAFRNQAFSSGNASDGRAAQAVINSFDDQVSNAVNGGQFKGDPLAVQAWNDARAAHSDYQRTFGQQGSGDPIGRVVQKILGKGNTPAAIPNDVADYMYGASGTNPNTLNVGVVNRVKSIMGEQSPEWSAVKQGLFSRLTETPQGVTDWGPGQVAQRVNKFLNGDGKEMSGALFSPAERAMVQNYADLMRKLQVPQAGANWSNTSTFLQNMAHRMGGWLGTVTGAALARMALPFLPWGVSELIGGATAVEAQKMVKAIDAAKVAKQMPLISEAMAKYQKAVATANKLNAPLGRATLGFAGANLSRTLEPLGMTLQGLQSPIPAAANQNQQNVPRPPSQQKNGGAVNGKQAFAHGGKVRPLWHQARAGQDKKLEHKAVKYIAKSKKPQHCAICTMFIAKDKGGPACSLVKNPIHAAGFCVKFEEKHA